MTIARTPFVANLWRDHPLEIGAGALVVALGFAVVVGTTGSTGRTTEAGAPPPPPAMDYRPVAAGEAVKINNEIPIAGPAGSARPFPGGTANAVAQRRALEMLGLNIAGERMVIIGDTPADIHCGRSLGVRAIGVATGRYTSDDLAAHHPAAVFNNLVDTDAVVSAILA